jgi:hypothetical protein
MYQRDYIMRMIEELVAAIGRILGLIRKGDYQQATQSLENAYYDMLKQDASFFQNIPKEELTTKLLREHHFTNGHLEILSELFYAQAELFYAQGKHANGLEFYEKSSVLLDFVVKESKTYSAEKQSRLEILKERINQLKNTVS